MTATIIVIIEVNITPQIQVGDAIIISGDIARHGIAVMLEREGLAFENTINSDCAILSGMVLDLLQTGIELHCLRDLTRGGLASALIELASSAKVQLQISETAVPITDDVKSACELLGFDPLYIANEGCCALFLPATQVTKALAILHRHQTGKQAVQIGTVMAVDEKGYVTLKTAMGIERVLDLLSGEQLPRIC